MQSLKKEFANYIRTSKYDVVEMYGPEGMEVDVKILKREKGNRTWTEFGDHWNIVCHVNNFKEGDVLKFRFVNQKKSNLMKVTKM